MTSWVRVNSSNVSALGYDLETGDFSVIYSLSGVYVYTAVEAQVALEITYAPSIGKAIAQKLKGKYEYTKTSTNTEGPNENT